jgi:hypothetical protein
MNPIQIANVGGKSVNILGIPMLICLMCVIAPSGFEGFFVEIAALAPQQ